MLWSSGTTPPLNALRAFEAVAGLGSFRAAIEALFVTQSAVSQLIHNVKQSRGKPLFERVENWTRVLPHGAGLARSLAASLAEIEAACKWARNSNQPRIIAAILSVAMCWRPPPQPFSRRPSGNRDPHALRHAWARD